MLNRMIMEIRRRIKRNQVRNPLRTDGRVPIKVCNDAICYISCVTMLYDRQTARMRKNKILKRWCIKKNWDITMRINYIIVIILGLWLFAGRRARARGLLKHVRAFHMNHSVATESSNLFSIRIYYRFPFLLICTVNSISHLPSTLSNHNKRIRAPSRLIYHRVTE